MANLEGSSGRVRRSAAPVRQPAGSAGVLDLATVLGLAGAFAMLAIAVVAGGSPLAFLDVPSLLIVVGGTIAVTSISFSLGDVVRAQPIIMRVIVHKPQDPAAAARRVLALSEIARIKGPLQLQDQLRGLSDEPFLHRAIGLVVDGTPAEEVERIVTAELETNSAHHSRSIGILRRASEVSPAMGLIGTLVGLIQMLGSLDDPKAIGPAMAVALLTTFYGAMLANMVFVPLAAKLDRNAGREALVNRIYAIGAGSIGRQENPRRLEILLNTALPPGQRIQRIR